MSQGPDGRESVSLNAACDIAGVSRRTIYNWIAANKVEYYRLTSGSLRIYRETLFRIDTDEEKEVRRLRSQNNSKGISKQRETV